MELPSIYTQPIGDLENFEMSADDLAVTIHYMKRINQQQNDLNGTVAKQSPVKAAEHIRITK